MAQLDKIPFSTIVEHLYDKGFVVMSKKEYEQQQKALVEAEDEVALLSGELAAELGA